MKCERLAALKKLFLELKNLTTPSGTDISELRTVSTATIR